MRRKFYKILIFLSVRALKHSFSKYFNVNLTPQNIGECKLISVFIENDGVEIKAVSSDNKGFLTIRNNDKRKSKK